MPGLSTNYLLLPLMAVILLLSGCAGAPSSQRDNPGFSDPLDALFQRLVGEYNNHEQVWQQEQDAAEDRLPKLHYRFSRPRTPGAAPALVIDRFSGSRSNGAPELTMHFVGELSNRRRGQRLLQAFAYPHAGAAGVATPDCDLIWREGGSLELSRAGGLCPLFALHQEQACPLSSLRLDGRYLKLSTTACNDRPAREYSGRRARYYTGWMVLQRSHLDKDAKPDDVISTRSLRLHNEGQILPLFHASGAATGYSIQLEQLTYQESGTPVLKLGIVDGSGKTLVYSWADVDASRIGINVRWFLAGLTAEGEGRAKSAESAESAERR